MPDVSVEPERVRPLQLPRDWDEWRRMRLALWPDDGDPDDMREWNARPDAATFVATRPDGSLCGFVEIGTRPYAEGCLTSPVPYIEGWYVDHDVRRSGHGRALFEAAERWARGRGYTEMASDALLDNRDSQAAHAACGFEETERVVTVTVMGH